MFPSISKLTYNPLFKLIVNSFDLLPKAMFLELRDIPPNHMRIRIGVSNRLFANGIHYKTAAQGFWMYCLANGYIRMDSTIVDIGSGCGRYAHILRDTEFLGQRFTGTYVGIDIDDELLDWCRSNFDDARFSFFHSSHASSSYVNRRDGDGYVKLPVEDDSADLVFSTSLFSHLLETELRNYVEESFRVLKPGGMMIMSVFCLDHPPPTYGNRHTFAHRLGNAFVESMAQPEAAVAYGKDFLISLAKEIGFKKGEIRTAENLWQPRFICTK
jgi:SAM-dependent methyltransferase